MDSVVSIPLKCSCPPSCKCGDKEPSLWKHKPCSKIIRINEMGDIFCEGHEQRSQCSPFFIQNARYQCSENHSWEEYRSASQFLMALAQGIQAAEFGLQDEKMISFVTKLNSQVMIRWKR